VRNALLAVAALAAVACTSTGSAAVGEADSDASALQLVGNDGKTHTLAELIEDGPVYLYFIKKDCPTNDQALPWYERVYEGLKRPKAFVGVINGDRAIYDAWNERYDAQYLVLLDPDKAWIHHFEAERSPWVVEVLEDGEVGRFWKGYSASAIAELDEALAKTEGVLPSGIDVSSLPERNQFG
jgi:peroxiredoxin